MGGEQDQLDFTPQPLAENARAFRRDRQNLDKLALKNDPYAYRDGIFLPEEFNSDSSDNA